MGKLLTLIAALGFLAVSTSTAGAWVRGPGVGVGKPGVMGYGGLGGAGRGLPGRPTPYRPYVGRVPLR